jgi:hypothetical protein
MPVARRAAGADCIVLERRGWRRRCKPANSASSVAVASSFILMDMRPPAGNRRCVMIERDARRLRDANLVRTRNTAESDMDVGGAIIKKYKAARRG